MVRELQIPQIPELMKQYERKWEEYTDRIKNRVYYRAGKECVAVI
jgi:hypothetical protein